MKMKPLLLTAAIAATGLFAVSASATDGTISFSGTINAATCTINNGSPNFDVQLPTVSAGVFAAAGDVAGNQSFDISLSNCTAVTLLNVSAFFEQSTTVNVAGRLDNTVVSGAASDVDLQLLNGSGSVINLASVTPQTNTSTAVISGNSATLSYSAQYYATAFPVGPGAVASTVDYNIEYN